MSKDVAPLTDKQQMFVDALVSNGGKVKEAAEVAGIHWQYGYTLKKELARHIAEAAQAYLSLHAVKAVQKVIETMDAEMPNPVQLNAANSILDRAGVKAVQEEEKATIKANIFILPEKRAIEAIETTFEEIK